MLLRPGAKACTLHLIAGELGVSETAMRPIVERLKHGGIVIESADSLSFSNRGHELFLARDSNKIPLAEVLGCLESSTARTSGDQRIEAIIESVSAAEHELLGGLTVMDLANGKITVPSSNPATIAHEQ